MARRNPGHGPVVDVVACVVGVVGGGPGLPIRMVTVGTGRRRFASRRGLVDDDVGLRRPERHVDVDDGWTQVRGLEGVAGRGLTLADDVRHLDRARRRVETTSTTVVPLSTSVPTGGSVRMTLPAGDRVAGLVLLSRHEAQAAQLVGSGRRRAG